MVFNYKPTETSTHNLTCMRRWSSGLRHDLAMVVTWVQIPDVATSYQKLLLTDQTNNLFQQTPFVATKKHFTNLENEFTRTNHIRPIPSNNPVYTTSDGKYKISPIKGELIDADFNYRITVKGPEISVSSEDCYRDILKKTEEYDDTEVRFTGAKMVGWFNHQKEPENRIEPDPKYVPAAIKAVSGQEIPARLVSVEELDDREEVEEYALSTIEEMEEIYQKI